MTPTEWKQFSDELLIAFPGIREYINGKSSNPIATLATWEKTLRDVSYSEASAVLDEWLEGSQEPPKAYERDYVALAIKARVGFKRTSEQKYRQAKSIEEEKRWVAAARKEYQPKFADLQDMFDFASVVAAKKLPIAEYNRIVADEFYRREKESA
jgi:hypothetical protein